MDIHFTVEKKPDEIRQIVELCDSSFIVGITRRENYLEILNKMQQYAEFIVPRSDDGTPLGYVSMYANNMQTKVAYISMFCIREEYQQLHLGTALMKRAVEVAGEKGMKIIRLEVLKENTKAQKFYLHNGFRMVSDNHTTSILMEYRLVASGL